MQSLAGTMWRVVGARSFDKDGHEVLPFGPRPIGFAIFEAERMLVAISDGTVAQQPNAPPRVFIAYTGTYRFDGRELVTVPEDASRPELIVEQVRHLRFESSTRMVAVPVSGLPAQHGIEIAWERVDPAVNG